MFITKKTFQQVSNKQSLCKLKSWWSHVEVGPPDAILGLTEDYNRDTNKNKINVGVGAYRDENGKPYILPCVRSAEQIVCKKKLNFEYSPISGDPEFNKLSAELAFGSDCKQLQDGLVVTCQTLSGTNALRIFCAFLKKYAPVKNIYIPDPSWVTHLQIATHTMLTTGMYRFYDRDRNRFDCDGALKDIKKIPEKSTILFHACAHNPTGVDPTIEEWCQLCHAVKKRKLYPFFDMAYQGFATGDIDRDAIAIRLFLEDGFELAIAQGYSKNFGLYGERVGCLHIVVHDKDDIPKVMSQLKILIRPMYSNPPLHGARIIKEILADPSLKNQWICELQGMASRINCMRQLLKEHLENLGSKKNWNHITHQIGMFCYTGMNKKQCERLKSEFHIYLPKDGRISMAGVTTANVEYLAQSMHEVTK